MISKSEITPCALMVMYVCARACVCACGRVSARVRARVCVVLCVRARVSICMGVCGRLSAFVHVCLTNECTNVSKRECVCGLRI